ncbi:MAG: alanine dehydrogenase [Bacillota bacterium]|nr:alanine dehydrogenase [Bacillota bacterium]
MIIGVLKEVKIGESRIVMTPSEVKELSIMGHQILIQDNAGVLAGFDNQSYIDASAKIAPDNKSIFSQSDMVVKVKEIVPEEYELLREGQIVFTCLHPAGNKEEVDELLKAKVIGITAEDSHRYGSPNAEAAGKLGALLGSYHLLSTSGGSGQSVFGIGGAPAAKALVLGAGIAGKGAAKILTSLGAYVYIADINIGILREVQYSIQNNISTMISNRGNIESVLHEVDLIINCVKWPKHRTDHIIYKKDLKNMQKGSVIMDVSADVGGAIETYKPTTHENPTYIVDGVVHYGVDNIPGIAPHTVSKAYAASMFPHISSIANLGLKEAMRRDGFLRRSLTVYNGILTHEETSVIQGRPFTSPEVVLKYGDTVELDFAPKATTTKIKK